LSLFGGKRLLFKITLGVTVSILVVEMMVTPVACSEREAVLRGAMQGQLEEMAASLARSVRSNLNIMRAEEARQVLLADPEVRRERIRASLTFDDEKDSPETLEDVRRVFAGERPAAPSRGNLVALARMQDSLGGLRGVVRLERGTERLDADVRRYALGMIFTILLVLLVTGASVTVFLYFVVLRPIHRMIEANLAAARGDTGEAYIPASEIPDDELGAIMESHNSMLRRLSRSRAIIQENNRVLQSINEELSAANRRLKDLDRVKSQFLANMSHELRTPLHSIIGFSELTMKTGTSLTDRERKNLGNVIRSARDLLALINEILDLSKIESGRVELDFAETDVSQVVDQCLQTVDPLAREKRLCVGRDIRSPLPSVKTDREKLRRILLNLLSNAIKFTDEGGVTVKAWVPPSGSLGLPILDLDPRDGAFVAIAVIDTGIGIAESDQRTIFEEFRQVDGSPTRRHKGSGLGLSIVKKLAALLGGDVYVRSRLGEGATFTVVMPVDIDSLRDAIRNARPA